MRVNQLCISVALAACAIPSAACDPIADSHIAANVPIPSQFDEFMLRDLEAYFARTLNQSVQVDYSLLRKGPTQSGIAYPKYYAWVTVYSDSNKAVLAEGAVRVAAVERVRFYVTDFVSKADIIAGGDSITVIFPGPVCAEIKKRVSKGRDAA